MSEDLIKAIKTSFNDRLSKYEDKPSLSNAMDLLVSIIRERLRDIAIYNKLISFSIEYVLSDATSTYIITKIDARRKPAGNIPIDIVFASSLDDIIC